MVVTRDMRRITTRTLADVGELEQEVVGGGEEQRAVDAVGDDVLVEQGVFLVGVVALVERHLVEAGRLGGLSECEEPGDDEADEDGGDQVERRRWRRR